MPSSLTWLDYSEHDRRKMLDIIQQFGEKATRDELGIGSVRDSFADQLFPGTSTIQTRARYFLFVPWIYRALEEKRISSTAIPAQLRKRETEVMQALIAADELSGIVGRRAQGSVQRLPSSIYWQGLATWGVRLFSQSQEEYYRSLDGFQQRRNSNRKPARHEFDGESPLQGSDQNWHLGLPAAPQRFPEGITFSLSMADAQYLRERILTRCPDSLLAHVLRERVPIEAAVFAWELKHLPRSLNEVVGHARKFSEVMHGAQILYNVMLAELIENPDLIERYRDLFSEWAAGMIQRGVQDWDLSRFWQISRRGNPRISERCRRFVHCWIDLVRRSSDLSFLADQPAARELVERREFELKKGLSGLRNLRARERWKGDSGIGQLDFRWTAAKRILTDILQGLEVETHA